MVVLKNGLLFDGVLYAVLDLVRGLFRLEVHQTAGVFPVFEDMNDGVCRPLALIAGVITAGAARPAVFQRSRRGDACSSSVNRLFGDKYQCPISNTTPIPR